MQQEAIARLIREHELEKARQQLVASSPVGVVVSSVQSVQSFYNILMIITGGLLVWSTYPNEECGATAPQQ
eukprot:scaffold505074_cov43-Prasinocladus_malaysianus.AAC.1